MCELCVLEKGFKDTAFIGHMKDTDHSMVLTVSQEKEHVSNSVCSLACVLLFLTFV